MNAVLVNMDKVQPLTSVQPAGKLFEAFDLPEVVKSADILIGHCLYAKSRHLVLF